MGVFKEREKGASSSGTSTPPQCQRFLSAPLFRCCHSFDLPVKKRESRVLLLLTHGAPVARRRVTFLRRADFLSALQICLDFETRMSTCFTRGRQTEHPPNLEAFSCTPAAPKNNQQGSQWWYPPKACCSAFSPRALEGCGFPPLSSSVPKCLICSLRSLCFFVFSFFLALPPELRSCVQVGLCSLFGRRRPPPSVADRESLVPLC